MSKKALTYNSAIEELETIVKQIEAGQVDVEILARQVKRASELIKFCNDRLKGAQQEVSHILQEMDNTEEKPV